MHSQSLRGCLLLLSLLALGACSTTRTRAPVEDRSTGNRQPVAQAAAPAASAPEIVKPPSENAGKPGYYTVKAGDQLLRIALDSGLNWRDVARWNNLDNPNLIEVGQVLRLLPPGVEAGTASTRPIGMARVDARPLDGKPPAAAASAPVASAGAAVASAPASAAATAVNGDDDVAWMWPANGPLLAGFDEQRNKGIDIGGKAGDPVVAAADGRVIFAGSALRGYGNMVIIKHNNTYLTAYAHNQVLLVKEEQTVRKGQRIAEMGSSDAEQVKLHFELRKQGKPLDPAKLLSPR